MQETAQRATSWRPSQRTADLRRAAVDILREPRSGLPLRLRSAQSGEEIESGSLLVLGESPDRSYPVTGHVARFVEDESYTASFGDQWNAFRRTQIDRFSGLTLSRDRLFSGTGWQAEELRGERVLEVGCGAGRFTQVLLDCGAEVFALDYSAAVDACWANNGPHPRLAVVQADLYSMPFQAGAFDRVLCYGVLQHTPDVRRAFMGLLPFLRPGGRVAVDVYLRQPWIVRWTAKYWYRPLTRRLPSRLLRRIVEWYVPRWLPVDSWAGGVPFLRRVIPALVPCWNYTGILPLRQRQLVEWAVLDTFDALSPTYDSPQTLATIGIWFREAALVDMDIRLGGNGIVANARKPLVKASGAGPPV